MKGSIASFLSRGRERREKEEKSKRERAGEKCQEWLSPYTGCGNLFTDWPTPRQLFLQCLYLVIGCSGDQADGSEKEKGQSLYSPQGTKKSEETLLSVGFLGWGCP